MKLTRARLSFARHSLCIAIVLMLLMSGTNILNVRGGEEPIILRCAIQPLKTTNPYNADQEDWKVLNLIYEGATKDDPVTGERLPYIAVGSANSSENTFYISWADCEVGNFGYSPRDSWEDPSKPEIVIFYNFEDILWHDGVQMNAKDILFTFQSSAGTQYPWLGHPLADLAGMANSNYTDNGWLFIQKIWESQDGLRAALKFTLQKPYYSVFDYYLSAPILPYHIWGNEAGNQVMNNTMLWYEPGYNKSDEYSWKQYFAVKFLNPWPIGSGPFMWAGSGYGGINLVPWDRHFYRPGFKYYSYQNKIMEQPRIDDLLLLSYTSEEQAVMDLESNRIDYIACDLSQSVLGRFADNENVKTVPLRATSLVYMGYNMKRKSFGYARVLVDQSFVELDYGKPLRRAIAHCVDSVSIVSQANPTVSDMTQLTALGPWDNASAPAFTFDPPEVARILSKARYVLTDPEQPPGEGNWWHNPDGTALGSSLEGRIQVLVAGPDFDPARFGIATMLVSQMRQVGIDSELVSLSPEDLAIRVGQRDYDICICEEDMTGMFGNRPENYVFTRFHSYNALNGPNHFGYLNYSLDSVILSSMDATDLNTRKNLAREMMAALAYDLPQDILYSVSHTEIYRIDNFDGLVDDGSGTLLNPRSIAGARMQERNALKAKFISLPITMISNLTTTFSVKVVDQRGNAMEGAFIRLEASSGSLLNETGITDQYGYFSTNFTAPYVPLTEEYNNWEAVTIRILSASLVDYRDAPAMKSLVTVFPDQLRHLYIKTTLAQDVISDTDASGNAGFTFLEILALDGSNIPVGGASLSITYSGCNVTLSETALRTDQDGHATIRITASELDNETQCMLRINASKVRFINASQELNFTIVPYLAGPEQAKESAFSQIAAPLAVSIILVSVMGALIYTRRRKNRKI